MKEIIFEKVRKGHTFIAVLGITALTLLMLVDIAGAEQIKHMSKVCDDNVSVIDTATLNIGKRPVEVEVNNESTVVEVTQLAQINESLKKGPVLLEIGSKWCGPCMKLQPTLKELATEYSGKVTVMSIVRENSPELIEYFESYSYPDCSVIVDIKNGKYVYMKENGNITIDRSQAKILGAYEDKEKNKKRLVDVLNPALAKQPPFAFLQEIS